MGFIRIFETPYPNNHCISDRWGWSVSFSGQCPPGHIQMGRFLVVYAGVNRADGLWQYCDSGTLTIKPLRTTGENDVEWNIPIEAQSANPLGSELRSWFQLGMITFPNFVEDAPEGSWLADQVIRVDIPRFKIRWDVEWEGETSPLIHFFDNNQKFIVAANCPVNDIPARSFGTGQLIMRPKNISWNSISIKVTSEWLTGSVMSCAESDQAGWLDSSGYFTLQDIETEGGLCDEEEIEHE